MNGCGDIGLRGWVSPWLMHSHGMEPNFVPTPASLKAVDNSVNKPVQAEGTSNEAVLLLKMNLLDSERKIGSDYPKKSAENIKLTHTNQQLTLDKQTIQK